MAAARPGGMRRSVKKTCWLPPSLGPKRAVPMASGTPLELSKTAASAMPEGTAGRQGTRSGTGEREPAETAEKELAARRTGVALEEAERAAWRARAEAIREEQEASAKVWEDVMRPRADTAMDPEWPAREGNSPPPTPPSEHRSKRVHDPAHQAEADARAAAEAASRSTEGDHEPAVVETEAPEAAPDASQDGGAGGGAGEGSDRGPKGAIVVTRGGAP